MQSNEKVTKSNKEIFPLSAVMMLLNLIPTHIPLMLLMVNMGETYQSHLHISSDPRFRQFEPHTENSTSLLAVKNQAQNSQRIAYFLPQPQKTAAFDRYRYEGNYYPAPAQAPAQAPAPSPPQSYGTVETRNQANVGNIGLTKRFIAPASLFDHRVYHTDNWSTEAPQYGNGYQQRRFDLDVMPKTTADEQRHDSGAIEVHGAKNASAHAQPLRDAVQQDVQFYEDADVQQSPPLHEIRSFHDIYMRMAGPNDLNLFGHVEHGPHLFEQRFESQNKGNRYKGEVLWADDTGGYGKQYWDLAQGKP